MPRPSESSSSLPPPLLARIAGIITWIAVADAALVGLTGAYLIPAALRSPGYFGIVRGHVGCAYLLGALVPAALLLQALYRRKTLLKAWRWGMLPLLLAGGAAAEVLSVVNWPSGDTALSQWVWSSYGDFDANDLTRLLAFGAALAVVGVGMTRPGMPRFFKWVAVSWCVIVSWSTGRVLLETTPRMGGVDAVHSLAGVTALLVVALALILPRLRNVPLRGLLFPTLSAALMGVTFLGWSTWYRHEHGRYFPVVGWEAGESDGAIVAWTPSTREEMLDPTRQRVDPDLLKGSMACGQADCHPIETEQWAGSNHRYAADNLVFQRVVQSLIEDKGPEATHACMNCHDPIRVLAGTVTEAWAEGSPDAWAEGVSCVACHAIVEVPDSPRNGEFAVRVPRPYPGETAQEQADNILLDPREHMRDMFPEPMLLGDEPCATCHRLEAGPDLWMATQLNISIPYDPHQDADPSNPGFGLACNDCHMLVTQAARGHEAKYVYDHEIPAVNPDIHLYALGPGADDPSLAEVSEYTRAFLEGDLARDSGFDSPLDGLYDETRHDNRAFDLLRRGWLLAMDVSGQVVGDELTVHVATRNHRSAHYFPSGSKDFRQVWQEIQVRDSAGRLVAQMGTLDDQQRVPPESHRLGGTVLDVHGDLLAKHRVWEAAKVVDVRVIAPGGSVEDDYTFALPDDVQLPLTVEVRWNLRHASAEFTEYVFDEPGKRFPVHTLGRAEVVVDLNDQRTQSSPAPKSTNLPRTR